MTHGSGFPGSAGQPQRSVLPQMAYLPPAQYEQAWARSLLDATNYREHGDYRREIEQTLRTMADHYPS